MSSARPDRHDNAATSARGEQLAAEWLVRAGWEIVVRNWTSDLGELDIVASRMIPWGTEFATQLAIVEVKSSLEPNEHIKPEAHVDARKRRKLVNLAKLFVAENRLRRVTVRFDVIGVTIDPVEIRHYPAAFDGSGRLRC